MIDDVVAALLEEMKDVRGPRASRIAKQNSGTPGASGREAWRPQWSGGQ